MDLCSIGFQPTCNCRGLVTSTFAESQMFADAGFDDILYGYPLLEAHMTRNYQLAEQLNEYHLFVTNMESGRDPLQICPTKG